MDLSSRVLIRNKSVDLFTDKKNSHIFIDDEILFMSKTFYPNVESYNFNDFFIYPIN